LTNVIFFAWTQGYLGTSDDGHEPQRLAQQLHADKLRVVADVPAAAAKKGEVTCRVVNGLSVADAESLKTAMAAAGAEAKILPVVEPTLYLALIADLANKAAADKKAAELKRLGIEQLSTVTLEGGRQEIILGSFSIEAAARDFMLGLAKKGIKSARLDRRQPPSLKAGVEARALASTLLPQLPTLIAPYADATVGECER
jgi:hypothetical protein